MRRASVVAAITFALCACGPSAAAPSASPKSSGTIASGTGATQSQPAIGISALAPLSDLVGFVALTNGAAASLMRTADGGRTWQLVGPAAIPNVAFLDELRFVDEQRGFSIARSPGHSWLLGTTNGGWDWRVLQSIEVPQAQANTVGLRGLAAADERTVWVIATLPSCDPAGCKNELRGSADGGSTWRSAFSPPGPIGNATFADNTHGWLAYTTAVANTHEVVATADGGRTWQTSLAKERFGSGENLVGVATATPKDAWVLTFDGGYCTSSGCSRYALRASHDAGLSWTVIHPLTDGAWWAKSGCGGFLGAPVFVDASRGLIPLGQGAGAFSPQNPGGLLVTDDAGTTFRCVRVTTDPSSIAIRFANAKTGWALATMSDQRQSISRSSDGGATWQAMTLPTR